EGAVGGGLRGVEDAHLLCPGEPAELGIVGDEGVQSAPDLEATVDGRFQPAAPLRRELAAGGRDADEHGGGTEREPLREIPDDGNGGAEAEHVRDCLTRLEAVQHADDPLGKVADAGVRGFGSEGAELAVGDDEEAVGRGRRHPDVWVLGTRNWPLTLSTAGSRWPVSP